MAIRRATAAGLLPLFNMGYATSHIHDYSVKLYAGLEAETGLNAGFTRCGNLRMAQTDARMDEYKLYSATAETVGVEHEFLTPAQIKERWPLVRTEDLIGALDESFSCVVVQNPDVFGNLRDLRPLAEAGARLARADLRGANLAGANFDGADLTAARLNKAAAPTATFRGARLVGADLEFARLFRADFSQADLRGANLEAAKLNYAWFRGARLVDANLQEAKMFSVNLRDADLSGSYRRFAVFQEADFEGCTGCPTDW